MSGRPNHPTSETKNKIAKLDSEILCNQVNTIIGNPGFPGINQNILFCLDHKSQMAYRQVCQSWKQEMDQPIFWIKKLNLKSHPNKLGNIWIDLVGRIQKGSNIEKEVIECLMKLYGGQFYGESALKGNLPTHIAAIFGYINIFMFVASYLENINAPRANGWTPLHFAARHGSTDIFKFLAPQVEYPNAPCDPHGWTPLHISAECGSTEIFKYLALQVEDPNAPYPIGFTPLHKAAQYGSTEIFKFLAPQIENPNAPGPNGWTPLHIAADCGSSEIFKFLAPQVGYPNAPAPNGLTTLQVATNRNHTEIVEFLSQML